MFAIFGSEFKGETIPFTKVQKMFCEYCRKEQPFSRVKGKMYFHIFFVPLYPVGGEIDGLQCLECKNTVSLPANFDFQKEKDEILNAEKVFNALNTTKQ
ncbi:zinc-ribbon domain-containing protein [Patescibacteria group bacterium]|nr:zinc-ribbon domain-containing protein [Patescibacteria group bacterium]MDE1946458.1 zinc-ribbon domain-containing protein [Patescibacteria group bacterium]MDE2011065.1 zinc-ribbon domain-containing protein [Patescibacteria group bacterium]